CQVTIAQGEDLLNMVVVVEYQGLLLHQLGREREAFEANEVAVMPDAFRARHQKLRSGIKRISSLLDEEEECLSFLHGNRKRKRKAFYEEDV
ncbi:hypothetical protein BGZ65_008704, partial [Modicella reniformis]